jgi:hypothetical protein
MKLILINKITMKKLKVLKPGLISPFQSFQYEIGKEYVSKDFDDDVTKDCSNGFYATDIEGLPYSWNIHRECWEVEVSGKSVIFNQYKQRFEKQTIIRKVEREEMISLAKAEEERLGYLLSEVLFPVNPLLLNRKNVTDKEVELLKQWASVWASVWDSVRDSVWDSVRDSVVASVWDSVWASVWASVWDSVRDSVWDSVRDSVWDSVRDSVVASVRDSVWDSVGVYISSLFPNITKWKYIEHKKGVNPFQSGIDLWRAGLVPSFDGKTWRLHGGERAEILYEYKKD